MKINNISASGVYKGIQSNSIGINIENKATNNYYQSCYPSNCYTAPVVSFGSKNVVLIEQIKKTKSENELRRLFEQMSETAKTNVTELAKRFKKEGLALESYLKVCIEQPLLFYRNYNTIEQNVRGIVKRFEKEGLSTEKYLPACVREHPLFCQSPDTIEKNVRGVVKRFETEGLSTEKYLSACIKGSLFHRKPNSISEHIDIIRLCYDNKDKAIDTPEFWDNIMSQPVQLCFSSEYLLIRGLIIPKMFEGEKIPKELRGSGLKQKLHDYLRNNPDKKCVLNIRKTDTKTDCISILSKYLDLITKDTGGKNIYSLNVY